MSRLDIMTPSHAQTVIDGLYRDVERRIAASPPGLCPVDLAKSFLDLCHAQTCGKCVPCRIGLGQLSELMEQVLEGEATMETISIIRKKFGISILLIEHDMSLVMSICERLVVIDYGMIIATGTPQEIARNPKVIGAYLGGE